MSMRNLIQQLTNGDKLVCGSGVFLCGLSFIERYASALTFLVGAAVGLGGLGFNIYWKLRQERKKLDINEDVPT